MPIGARGTGKTTVLELVRYAMDALPADPTERKRVEDLVLRNLRGGRVDLSVRTKDGMAYTVSRAPGEDPIISTVDGTVTEMADWVASMRSQADAGCMDLAYARKHLAKMADRIATMQAVLEDMREFSRTTPSGRTTEALHRLVADAVGLCQDWFAASGVDISMVQITAEVPPTILVSVSRHQMVVALRNVVKNAIESLAVSPLRLNPGSVRITARQDEGLVIIRVADTGMGLTAEELDEVRRFVPGKTSKKSHGTGFGLPIAWRKIQDHGGSLSIDSRPDTGTTVTIAVPVQTGISEDE